MGLTDLAMSGGGVEGRGVEGRGVEGRKKNNLFPTFHFHKSAKLSFITLGTGKLMKRKNVPEVSASTSEKYTWFLELLASLT